MREYHRKLIAIVEEYGGEDIRLEPRGKHYALRFSKDGRARTFFCANSPSDRRSVLNAKSDLKRFLAN